MNKRNFSAISRLMALTIIVGGSGLASAQTDPPELSSWLINKSGATGFNGQTANVLSVQYSDNNVYVAASGIPSYSIGPWRGNPNTARVQNYLFRIPRKPTENIANKITTPLGPIGVLTNGVPLYNASDARSYNNQNVWHQNAQIVEGPGFDSCLGHPQQQGGYHHHVNPKCLYVDDPTQHSPLLGYAFDGYPIYGPRGCANADGTGGVKLLKSSYRLRNIAQRNILPDGAPLHGSQAGPDVSLRFPLGYYLEDFEYVTKLGDLDQFNARFAVTPEYPKGTYAYYVTLEEDGSPAYPYLLGPQYYGTVAADNFMRGHVSIGEIVQTYQGSTLARPQRDCR